MLTYTNICQHEQGYAGICWHAPAHTGIGQSMPAKMGIHFVNTSMQQEPSKACFLHWWHFVKSHIFKEFLRKKLPNSDQKWDFSLISYPPSPGRIQKQHNHLILPFKPTPQDWIGSETPNWSIYTLLDWATQGGPKPTSGGASHCLWWKCYTIETGRALMLLIIPFYISTSLELMNLAP